MRTAICLLLALALLLTGCPASDPAIPTSQEAKSPVTESAMANEAPVDPNATTLEVTDIPSSLSEPRLDENAEVRHAAAFEGDVSLEGSGVTGGGREANPFLVQIPASTGDLVQVHLRGTLESGGVGTLTAQVSVPGYSTIISIPATDAWVYKAFYMPSSGMLEIRLFNGATYNGPLNIDAATMSYYAKGIPTPFADEPNADNNGATLTDRSMASTIALATPTTRGLIQVAGGPVDTEEWYSLTKDLYDPELKVTFDAYNHRYGAWQYEVTFFDSYGVQLGLKTIFQPPAAAKVFYLSRLPMDYSIYMRVLAKPLASALTTNAAYALHSLVVEAPLAIRPIAPQVLTPLAPVTFRSVLAGNPSQDAIRHWDFGGGGQCTDLCNTPYATVITGEPGRYTASVWAEDGARRSRTVTFTYELTCHRWAGFNPTWTGSDVPGAFWDYPAPAGTLVSSGGQAYAITQRLAGDVRTTDLSHQLGATGQLAAQQLDAVSHAGRLYIAFIDQYTHHLMLWVSSDAVPNQISDWKLVTLDERTVANKPIDLASSGNRLGVLYSTGAAGRDLRLAYSKTVLGDRQLDWGTGIVQRDFMPTTHSLTAHANRWWTAQLEPGPGRIMISSARDLAPFSESHWNAHPLVAASLDDPRANISLMSVEGGLTAVYAIPNSSYFDLRMAKSTVAVPFTTSDWLTTTITQTYPGAFGSQDYPSEPSHTLMMMDGEFFLGFQDGLGIAVWRSCDLSPQTRADWSRSHIWWVDPIGEYPRTLLGLTAPGGDFIYALYVDSTSTQEIDVMRLHQLRLDFW